MTGIPALSVKLDDGTGTWPSDITQYVRLVDGITWSRGRPDQFQSIGPGSLSLTLENIDGTFSFDGTGAFGVGAFGLGGFGGAAGLSPNQPIRLSVAGQVRFTGRIQSSVVQWPTGGQEFAVVQITAIDDLARAARHILGPSSTEEILVDSPAAYYPLNEEQPASGTFVLPSAGDITGNPQNPVLTKPSGFAPTSVVFGTDLALPDGSTGVTLTGGFGNTGQLRNKTGITSWSSTNSLHFDVVFAATSGAGTLSTGSGTVLIALALDGVPVTLNVSSSQVITFGNAATTLGTVITYGAAIPNTATHVISINSDASSTDLWFDGVKVATGAGISGTWSNAINSIGDDFTLPTNAQITLGHFNFGPKLSDARVLAHHSALFNDFLGETPTDRITRIAGYASLPVGTLDTSGSTIMGPSAQAGRSPVDIFADITDATQGLVFVDANGAISNITGFSIAQEVFPDAIHDANLVSTDTQVEVDMANLVNKITGKATGSENVTTAMNADSIEQHGVYPQDYTWNVSTDDQARDRTNWQINTYAQPFPRVPTMKYNVMSMTLGEVLNALRIDLGQFASVQNMPSQSPGDLYLIVEGVSETITTTEWSITVNGARHALTVAWFLGDSFFGVLGASTKLYF